MSGNKAFYGIIISAIALIALLTLVNYAEINNDVTDIKTVIEPVRSEKILTDWVYERSNRISRGTCKLIVQEAMKTPKPLLLLSIMDVESNFVPTATSIKGAMGLCQIMPGVWEKEMMTKGVIKERRDLYDIRPNILVGGYVLHIFMVETKSDAEKALEKYLGGRDGVYVKKILNNLAHLYYITESKLQ